MLRQVEIFSQVIGMFPLCAGLGLLAIVLLTDRRLSRMHAPEPLETRIMVCIPFSLLFGVVLAYLFDLLFIGGFKALFTNPWGYGLTFYGWLTGCIIFYFFYAKFCKLNFFFLLNHFLPLFALAQGFGRIGCFLGGCCFGKPTTTLGVVYPQGSVPYAAFGSTPLIPIQLYEAAYLFILFAVLCSAVKFHRRAGWYLIGSGCGRFVCEFFRADERGSSGIDLLSPSQMLGIILVLFGIWLLCRHKLNRCLRSKEV